MNDMKRDLIRIQELVGMAFSETESLVALTDGGQMNPNKLQKTLEQTMEQPRWNCADSANDIRRVLAGLLIGRRCPIWISQAA